MSVRHVLQNEKYLGTIVYNRTTQKLKTARRPNPEDKWVRTPDAFEGLISAELFAQVQARFAARRQKYDPDFMLEGLRKIYVDHDFVHPALFKDADLPSPSCFGAKFGSMDFAFQQLFAAIRNEAREKVHTSLHASVGEVLPYADFFVLGRKLTIAIQPVVPTPHGFSAYWPLRRDRRSVIDVTLGVLLAEPKSLQILGYILLPRWMQSAESMRVFCTSQNIDLMGHHSLEFLSKLIQ